MDPDGNEITIKGLWIDIGESGFRDGAPQGIAGYGDWMDSASSLIGFDIDAISINAGNCTVRLWKGNYAGVAKNMQERCSKKGLNIIADALSNIGGCGGEIGLYNKDNGGIGGGSSMSPEQMAEMGIVSTEIAIVNKLSRRIIGRRKESTPSFWTTYFSWGNNSSKEEIFTLNIFNFKDKDSASSFANKLKDNHDKAIGYKHNRNLDYKVYQRGTKVTVSWGDSYK
ncbi:hypothetical protein HNP77_001073 [Treponema rectale]|uniref:Uncharacterized protein n=1 Tax=Treponema rectale TaxID=744512 RepID=A0A840SCX8_9SPIR|nr:hypothetical protein [Treponema rectale]MBB5218704.1 hypothetical protein [Treponema rectale]